MPAADPAQVLSEPSPTTPTMNTPLDLPVTMIDPDDIGHNTTANPDFDSVLKARLSRRSLPRAHRRSGVRCRAMSRSNAPASPS